MSPDKTFTTTGDVTGILWQDNFDTYLEWLHKGLTRQSKAVLSVFKAWDEFVFPEARSGLGGVYTDADASDSDSGASGSSSGVPESSYARVHKYFQRVAKCACTGHLYTVLGFLISHVCTL